MASEIQPVPAAHGGTAIDPVGHSLGEPSPLDRSFGKAVLAGYLGGLLVIFTFMLVVLSWAGLELGQAVAASVGVAIWIGIMGGVVAVGTWTMRHEEEIYH